MFTQSRKDESTVNVCGPRSLSAWLFFLLPFSRLKQVHSVIEWLSFHKHTASISYTDCGTLWKIYKGMKINNLYQSQALGFFPPLHCWFWVCECIHIVRGRKEEEQRSESQCFGLWERERERERRAVTDSPPFLHLLSETNNNFSLVCAVVVFPLLSLFFLSFSQCPAVQDLLAYMGTFLSAHIYSL